MGMQSSLRFPGLAVDPYKVSVSSTGFKTNVIEDVVLKIGQTRTLDTNLTVGTMIEVVDVRAENLPADCSVLRRQRQSRQNYYDHQLQQ